MSGHKEGVNDILTSNGSVMLPFFLNFAIFQPFDSAYAFRFSFKAAFYICRDRLFGRMREHGAS